MADVNAETGYAATARTDRANPDGVSGWFGAGVLALLAVAMWGGSLLLSARPPFATGFLLWRGFAESVLHDTLQAGAILAVGAGLALLVYRPLVAMERRIWTMDRRVLLAVLAVAAAAQSVYLSYFGLGGSPHIPDEVAMLFQAKNFARGQLYAPAPPIELRPFFEYEYIILDGPKWYGKYFLGPSLLLVPGVWLGAPWVINPLLGGLAVWLFYALGRELVGEKTGRIAAILAAVSPFRTGLYAVMMAHGGCLVLAMVFAVCVVRALREPSRYRYWLTAAAAFGMMVHFRPVTALAIGIPTTVGAVLLGRWREVRPGALLVAAGPLAVGAALFLGYNYALTGDALVTPFEHWSKHDRMGFGENLGMEYWPEYDRGHDLANAFKNLYMNLDAVALNLLGWGRGTLLLMAAGVVAGARRGAGWISLAAIASVAFVYFFYHFSGALAGQSRYWSEAMGFMMVLAVGGLTALRRWLGGGYRRFAWRSADARARAALWMAGLGWMVYCGAGAYREMLSEFSPAFLGWNESRALIKALETNPLHNAIVFIPTQSGPMDDYAAGAGLNSPNLDGPVVFARDLGEARNRIAQRHFAGREAYRFVNDRAGPPRFERLAPP